MLTVDYIAKFGCNLISFLFIWTLHIDCLHIDDLLPRRRSRAEFGLVISLYLYSVKMQQNNIDSFLICCTFVGVVLV